MINMQVFDAPWKMVQFINDEGIAQADIQGIWPNQGQWYLFYWTP